MPESLTPDEAPLSSWEMWAPFREPFLLRFPPEDAAALRRVGWRLCQLAALPEYQEEAPPPSLHALQMAAIAIDLRQAADLLSRLAERPGRSVGPRRRETPWLRLAAELEGMAQEIDGGLEILRGERE